MSGLLSGVLFAVVLCVALAIATGIVSRIRLFRIARSRGAGGFEDFAARMAAGVVPQAVQRVVFDYLRAWVPRNFPLRPEDELGRICGIEDGDVYGAVAEIGSRTGRAPPPTFEFDPNALVSIRDLAEYVARLPEIDPRPRP